MMLIRHINPLFLKFKVDETKWIFYFFLDIIRHHIGAGTACNLSPSTAGDAVKEPLNHPVCKYRSLKWETGSYIECVFGVLTNRNSKTRQR